MTRFIVTIKTSIEKDLRKIPHELISSILSRIEELAENPYPRDAAKLSGAEHFYRIRVGEYRIVYQVFNSEHEVIIYYIRHRSIAYRTL